MAKEKNQADKIEAGKSYHMLHFGGQGKKVKIHVRQLLIKKCFGCIARKT